MAAKSYTSGFSWCKKSLCMISDLFMFCCWICTLHLVGLLLPGCVIQPGWSDGDMCCHLGLLVGSHLSYLAYWPFCPLLSLLAAHCFAPCSCWIGWAIHHLLLWLHLWVGAPNVCPPALCALGHSGWWHLPSFQPCCLHILVAAPHDLVAVPMSIQPGWGSI